MSIESLGYVRLSMQEPQVWASLGTEILGFEAAVAEDESVRLRMDELPFRYLIEQSDTEGFVCAGWECSKKDFPGLVARLEDQAVHVEQGDAAACAVRGVAEFVSAKDPSGNLLELFHSREPGSGFTSPLGLDYVAGNLGLGHAVLPAPNHAETCDFYESLLGFGLSDVLHLPPPAEGLPSMEINFYHALNPRHHSLALLNGPAPSGVIHLMTELTSLDSVGACLDRVKAAKMPIMASLGRHVNDGMVSFYFVAPGGIPMEVGFDGTQHDWKDFKPTQSTVGDYWGHAYNLPE